jgi:hypothetical protein
MRKPIFAALTLAAAIVAFAGPSQAYDSPQGEQASLKKHHKRIHEVHQLPSRPPEPEFRIPAHPVVRDCVHVFFPQCSRGYEGLNDGTFGRY